MPYLSLVVATTTQNNNNNNNKAFVERKLKVSSFSKKADRTSKSVRAPNAYTTTVPHSVQKSKSKASSSTFRNKPSDLSTHLIITKEQVAVSLGCEGSKNNCAVGCTEAGLCVGGCKAGWRGIDCKEECEKFTYGPNCELICGHCRDDQPCDQTTGACINGCVPGWRGRECNEPCNPFTYGYDCAQICGHCRLDKHCNMVSGYCSAGCKLGWTGEKCDESCPKGFYGLECAFKCGFCAGAESCNFIDGRCNNGCTDGFTGEKCLDGLQDETTSKKYSAVPVLVSCIVFLVLLFSATIVYFICLRPRHGRLFSRFYRLASRNLQDPEPHIYEQVLSGPWELNKYNLILTGEKLGHGQFGLVKKGFVSKESNRKIPVAVKSLKGTASEKDKNDFMNELNILKKVGQHPNVVCLVGACHIQGTLYVAMEYAENGDLRSYLRKSRRSKQNMYQNYKGVSCLQRYILIKFALDAACGLRHLAEKQIIHRDVAARNVLLDENLIAKVADFGLSKHEDTYVKTSNTRVPVRWLAPESLFNAIYTTQSDVWSFGILLWEIMSMGGTPYHGIDTQTLCNLLKQGYRIRRPRHCDATMYAMMMQCWNEKPECRPTFHELYMRLQRMVEDSQIYMNIELNEGNQYAEIDCARDPPQKPSLE
ncbi:hypothetical protein KUTeg_016111 [Tegillarca granosa]|uniref:Protein kinase domain-containing protein n=1 Tax=Tegillarca granosa TaxID=220873 RepID=A0ABQ9EMF4_TEGGR|nr:hypothetical protein KUTeg_016111 [Tegillarca granosa]